MYNIPYPGVNILPKNKFLPKCYSALIKTSPKLSSFSAVVPYFLGYILKTLMATALRNDKGHILNAFQDRNCHFSCLFLVIFFFKFI